MSADDPKVERVHCNGCGRETRHLVVVARSQPGSETYRSDPYDPGVSISWCTTYTMLECCGCEEVSVRRNHWFSEWDDNEKVEYFPPRISRRAPNWLRRLPGDLQALMEEVYTALHADSRRLSMMGARAALDMFIVNKVGDAGTFVQKLAALEKEGYVSSRDQRILRAALDVGSAAAHRGHEASPEVIEHVIDIVENLLQGDLLDPVVEQLERATPPRTPRKKQPSPEVTE